VYWKPLRLQGLFRFLRETRKFVATRFLYYHQFRAVAVPFLSSLGFRIRVGDMLYLSDTEPHSVAAIEDSSFLLTIVFPSK
jgi:hypothetical protein